MLFAPALVEVERARDLYAVHPVAGLRVTRADLIARVKAHVGREVPQSAIRAAGLAQQLLGLFPTADDYETAMYGLLEAGLAGYYEPSDGTMYMADDLDATDTPATLWHELVHALQDQKWDLAARTLYVAGNADLGSATSSLAEGDATSAMVDLLVAHARPDGAAKDIPDDLLLEKLARSMDTGKTAHFPRSLRRDALAPYVDGFRFVNALRRDAGWAEVEDAWVNPPTTTEQVLHVEKWRAHEPALTVADSLAPAGFGVLEANTYGEVGLRSFFAEWTTSAVAATAASGWGGDRVSVFQATDGAVALAWHVRYDDASPRTPDAFAARAFATLASVVPRLGRVVERSPRAVCVERKQNGVMRATRSGRDLFVTVGSVARGGATWQPIMTCADVRAWSGKDDGGGGAG